MRVVRTSMMGLSMLKSISLRFNVITSAVVILLLAGFGAYNFNATKVALRHQLEEQLDALSSRLKESLPATLWNYENAQTEHIVTAEMASSEVAGIYVFDDKGKLVLGRQKDESGKTTVAKSLPKSAADQISAPLIYNDNGEQKSIGKVQIIADESTIQKLLHESLVRQGIQTLVLVAILIGAVSILLRQLVTSPIRKVTEALKDIAQGEGDLTRRLEITRADEIGDLASNFNLFVEKIRDMVSRVIESVDVISSSISELQGIAQRTSEGVDRQRAETDQVATAMTEMSSTAQSMAESAESAAASARRADEQGQLAKNIVDDAISAIGELARDIHGGTEVIADLERNVSEITSVLDVIRGIAEQTNLLALNAAIEAARAGEQGRGFAVVADEVRALASRTQSSTEEINSMIGRLEEGARKAVTVMEQSRTGGERTVERANQAGGALQEVALAVSTINDMNTQIASAAEEQTAVANDITASLTRIVEIAETTAKDTVDTYDFSNRLDERARQLHQLVGHFQV